MLKAIGRTMTNLWQLATRPASVIAIIGIGGFLVDMFVKPISNAGLILLLAASAPWVLRTVKRIKVGDYLEFENLSPTESQKKLETEAQELLEDGGDADAPPEEHVPHQSTGASISPDAERIKKAMRGIRVTESLVLDWVERSVDTPVRRNVRLGNFWVDGVALTKPAPTLIEIKSISKGLEVGRRLREVTDILNQARHAWKIRNAEWPKAMVVLATKAEPGDGIYEEQLRAIDIFERGNVDGVEIKLVTISELFGIDPAPKSE